ncbi:hypothetical protein [Paenibacillus apii]|uniref:hypothetical protein n=1 Tax=Paenibacillus apii TaxID=1850370 RepID=UPI001439F1E9|nr:hypothetical protein [Paenibacillus apii]NJJ37862.1 hypothetical protein [Paenibacillus apii]
MERKIYNGYAFSDGEQEKAKINRDLYNELKNKFKVYRSDLYWTPDVDLNQFDVVIGRKAGYAHAEYNIIKNGPNLSKEELLLLCDSGSLCFGGSQLTGNKFRVSED